MNIVFDPRARGSQASASDGTIDDRLHANTLHILLFHSTEYGMGTLEVRDVL